MFDSMVAALPESTYKARDDHLPYLIFLWYVAWNSVTDVADAACAVKVESSWIKTPRKPGLLEDWESNVVLWITRSSASQNSKWNWRWCSTVTFGFRREAKSCVWPTTKPASSTIFSLSLKTLSHYKISSSWLILTRIALYCKYNKPLFNVPCAFAWCQEVPCACRCEVRGHEP